MKKDNQTLISLFDLAEVLSHQSNFQEILRLVSDKALEIFKADFASVVMINPRTQKTVKTVIRKTKTDPLKGLSVIQTNVIGWMMLNRQSFLSENIVADKRFAKDLFVDSPVGSVLAAPIRYGGANIGYLAAGKRFENPSLSSDDLALAEKFALLIAPYLSHTQKIQTYFNAALPENALVQKYAAAGLLGKSPAFIELLQAIEAAARCDARVLLEGRTGTGKELIARAIHKFSDRSEKPFIAIDCGAIPENLVESELFGHVKGAFTGAASDRRGLMEAADGGTLFIDEVANLPLPMQTKLMRALQESEVRPVGSNKARKIDLRIIAASSASLRELMGAGKFREDLFYRLYVYPIKVPALAERSADIPLLADYFLEKISQSQGKKTTGFSPQLIAFLQSRPWNGNIRELESVLARAVILSADENITEENLRLENKAHQVKELRTVQDGNIPPLKESLDRHSRFLLIQALTKTGWNQSKAAEILHIHRSYLVRLIKRLGISSAGPS